MSYIGNTVENQNYVPAVDYFNGNGSTTAFTLSRPVASVAAVQAVISNVPQNPGSAFTVSGSTITFTSAPPSGTNNIYVYYTSPNTQTVQPGQGTVTTTSIADGSVTPAKLSTGYPYWDASGNVGVGTSSPVSAGGYTGFTVKNTTYGGIIQNTDGTVDFRSMLTASTNALVGTWSNHPTSFVTNATARMTIDSSGRITMPYQPIFHAQCNAAGAPTAGNDIVFPTVKENIGSCYNSANGKFTAPIAGTYFFYGAVMATTGTGRFVWGFFKNGSNTNMIQPGGDSTNYGTWPGTVAIVLAANDYITMRVTIGTAYNATNETNFGGWLIG